MQVSSFCLVIGLVLAAIGVPSFGQDFKPYPGSKLDQAATREASAGAPAGKQSEVYTTPDSLEKVYAFYKGMYKELAMRSPGPNAPTGQPVKWFFFIIDGGTIMANSKLWMKIQRPYVGGAQGRDVRDVTVIQTVRTK